MSYYSSHYNYTSSQSYKSVERPTIMGRLGMFAMLLLSLCSSAAYILTLLTPYVEPSSSWTSPILGLVAPATFLLNTLLVLYWIIRWRWGVATPMLLVMVFGFSNISLFAKMPFTKSYGIENYNGAVKVMSYNVRGLVNDNKQRSTQEVAKYIAAHKADIICLQEYIKSDYSDDSQVDDFDKHLAGYHKSVSGALAIYSRFPIYRRATLLSEMKGQGSQIQPSNSSNGGSMWADVIVQRDTIRIFNNHLHSTDIKAADDAFLTSRQLVQDNDRHEKVRSILSRFKNGSIERARQVHTISRAISRSPYSVIVCGDFNDTPISYTYNLMSQGLLDSFQERGDVYPYTYRGFYNTLRIDYILSSARLQPESYSTDTECHFSDHLPIITHLRINQI